MTRRRLRDVWMGFQAVSVRRFGVSRVRSSKDALRELLAMTGRTDLIRTVPVTYARLVLLVFDACWRDGFVYLDFADAFVSLISNPMPERITGSWEQLAEAVSGRLANGSSISDYALLYLFVVSSRNVAGVTHEQVLEAMNEIIESDR